MASNLMVPLSKDTLFLRNFHCRQDPQRIRSFFSREVDSEVHIVFFNRNPDSNRLFIALRFSEKDDAKDMLEKYDGSEILGDKVQITFFRDVRRAKEKAAEENRRYEYIRGESPLRNGFQPGQFRKFGPYANRPDHNSYRNNYYSRHRKTSEGDYMHRSNDTSASRSRSRSRSNTRSRSRSYSSEDERRSRSPKKSKRDKSQTPESSPDRSSSMEHKSRKKHKHRKTDSIMGGKWEEQSSSVERSPEKLSKQKDDPSELVEGNPARQSGSEADWEAARENGKRDNLHEDITPDHHAGEFYDKEQKDGNYEEKSSKRKSQRTSADDELAPNLIGQELERGILGLPPDKYIIVREKKDEIERAYKKDCETFSTAVKMLVSKNPALERSVQDTLRENLKDVGQRCIQELREFIDKLKSEYQA